MTESESVELEALERTEENAQQIFQWENEIRQDTVNAPTSFNNHLLTWDEHWNWFCQVQLEYCFFIKAGGQRVGFVKSMEVGPDLLMGMLVAKTPTGRGYASKAFYLYGQLMRERFPDKALFSDVFDHNIASIKSLIKGGHREICRRQNIIRFAFVGR